jgi:hypothetical protein
MNRLARSFTAGDRVQDKNGRTATVIEEWGAFGACPQCSKLVPLGMLTPCCGVHARTVPGGGTYDIRYDDGELHSINQCRLKHFGDMEKR